MEYVILDLEWNQPVSKESYPYRSIGDRMANEIIHIGAYKVSEERKITDSFCTYVRPEYYKRLNSVVKRLTNIDKEAVLAGKEFPEAAALFRAWCPPGAVIFTWGSDDIYVMKQNLEFYGIDPSFISRWYDLQIMFSTTFLGERAQKSLSFALDYFDIKEEATKKLHDALDDAYYTAQIFLHHDIGACMESYPAECRFQTLWSELSDTEYGAFYSKRKAMENRAVSQVLCPDCGEELKKVGTWVQQNGKYVCVASCEEHGEFVSRVKINKHLDGKFYVNKVTRREEEQVRESIKARSMAQVKQPGHKRRRRKKAKAEQVKVG